GSSSSSARAPCRSSARRASSLLLALRVGDLGRLLLRHALLAQLAVLRPVLDLLAGHHFICLFLRRFFMWLPALAASASARSDEEPLPMRSSARSRAEAPAERLRRAITCSSTCAR